MSEKKDNLENSEARDNVVDAVSSSQGPVQESNKRRK